MTETADPAVDASPMGNSVSAKYDSGMRTQIMETLSLELQDGYLVVSAAKGLDRDDEEKKYIAIE